MINRFSLTAFVIGFAVLHATAASATPTPDSVLGQLKKGNERYISGHSVHPRIDAERRQETARSGQKPVASILGCADSRVPPEIVFDQGFADLFVVRVAGNVCGTSELASLEYGVQYLNTPLVVVLGHSKCGAVQAALAGKPLLGSLPKLMEMIEPAVKEANSTKGLGADAVVDRAVKDNVFHSMSLALASPLVAKKVRAGELKVVGAVRAIDSGKITWLGEHPDQAELLQAKSK